MTTAITTATIPAPTPMHASSLSPQELAEHRQAIASEVKVILSAYFQPHEAEEIRAAQLAWWCDELQDWTREQVVWALRKWNRDHPRHRPTPGDILRICKETRGRKIASQLPRTEPQPERKPVDAETAAKIMAEVGFSVKRMRVHRVA